MIHELCVVNMEWVHGSWYTLYKKYLTDKYLILRWNACIYDAFHLVLSATYDIRCFTITLEELAEVGVALK